MSLVMIRFDLVLRVAVLKPHLYQRDCEAVIDAMIGRIINTQ